MGVPLASACGETSAQLGRVVQSVRMSPWTDLDAAYFEIFGEHPDLVDRPTGAAPVDLASGNGHQGPDRR
jgi:hypothetical protein